MAQDVDSAPSVRERPAAPPLVRNEQDILKALFWMGLSLLAFVLVTISVREAGRSMSAIHVMFYRSFISLIILLVGLRIYGIPLARLGTHMPGMQLARAFAHFLGQWSWMQALLLIPMVELFALEFTAPLWVAVLAPFLLGERLTVQRIVAAVIGFIGALVVIGPAATSMSLGSVLALFCAFMFSLNIIGTKYLLRHDTALTILLFMTANHTVMCFVVGARDMPWPDAYAGLWLLILGAASLAAHFALARGMSYADAIVVAPMDFMRLPFIAVVGIALYNEPLRPIVLLGTALVIAGNVVNLWGERRGLGRS